MKVQVQSTLENFVDKDDGRKADDEEKLKIKMEELEKKYIQK